LDVNHVILSGTLIRNPEIRYNPKGIPVITFTLAFSHPSRSVRGKTQEEMSSIEVIALGSSVENYHEALKEGRKVLVNGKLKQRRWTTPQGINRNRLELVADRIHCLEMN
jgi:single-strand DNA-binding protein